MEIILPFDIHGYTLVSPIGEGSFSTVYYGTKNDTEECFAIKVINKSELKTEKDVERLQREIDTMALLNHDSIIKLHDFFTDSYRFFLILDYCQGGDLFTLMTNSRKLRDSQIAQIFQQIVSAVNYCHSRGVAHRDLKPQNILITHFPFIKVSDFGLCGYISESKMKTYCGSPFYTAPECLSQIKYDGKKSDVWSLGVILFELATGTFPWNPSNTPAMIKQIKKAQYIIPRGINPGLEDLIRSMLKLRPSDRPTCAQILAHPFMKLVPSRLSALNSLPPLQPKPIPVLTKLLDRTCQTADNGIYSPFCTPQIPPCSSDQNIPRLGNETGVKRAANVRRSKSGTIHGLTSGRSAISPKKSILTKRAPPSRLLVSAL